jgi:hypothetical protein
MLEPPSKRQFAGALFPSVIPSEARNLAVVTGKRPIGSSLVVCATRDDMRLTGGARMCN